MDCGGSFDFSLTVLTKKSYSVTFLAFTLRNCDIFHIILFRLKSLKKYFFDKLNVGIKTQNFMPIKKPMKIMQKVNVIFQLNKCGQKFSLCYFFP